MAAVRGQHRLSRAVNHQAVSMDRLSSGHKIHSAKDDPAGLQISNRLQAQNRGLDVAIRNANDGISMLQTAEGAMAEYTESLTSMRDLTLRYGNGSINSEDRAAIRQEYNALKDELNRITETTSFGGLRLLNGEARERSFQIGADSGEAIKVILPNLGDNIDRKVVQEDKIARVYAHSTRWRSLSGDTMTFYEKDHRGPDLVLKIKPGSSVEDVANQINDEFGDKVHAFTGYSRDHEWLTSYVKSAGGRHFDFFGAYSVDDDTRYIPRLIKGPSWGSATNDPYDVMRAGDFRIVDDKEVSEIEEKIPPLNDETPVDEVLSRLDTVLTNIDSERAKLGAAQNRLSHAINNLSQTSESVAASNSQIRDTDFAREASKLTKQSILKEVNTSMLAQASKTPEGVLSLLS